jgi:hypothetical protein
MIDAQAALTTARANHYQAVYAHIIAKLDFQKAMGTLTSAKITEPEEQAKAESVNARENTAKALVE